MSALLWMVSISFLLEPSEAEVVTYVILDPDWRTIFRGEKMSFTCNVYSTTQTYGDFYWYKDNQEIQIYQQKFQINSAEIRHSGKYQCETTSSERSDPVSLDVSNDWVILQVPPYIYEGDRWTTNCHGWDNLFSKGVKTYKDNQIKSLHYYVDKTVNGVYKCERKRFLTTHTSNGISVLVHDLFSVPVLKLTQSIIREGDEMTLICDTTLALRRRTTTLQFAFYKDEQKIWEFSENDKYRISSVRLEHSGKYSCEVTTLLGTVKKMSDSSTIHVQELFKTPVLEAFPSANVRKEENVALQCVSTPPSGSSLLYSFFRGSRTIRDYTVDNTYIIPRASEESSGNYKCSSKSANNKVLKYSEDLSIVVKKTFDDGAIGKGDFDRSVGVDQPRLKILPEKVMVNDEVTLHCESSKSFFPMYYRFYHNGTILGNVTSYKKRFVEMRHIIKVVTMTGPYYCDSRNDISTRIQRSGTVNVFVMDPVANVSITMAKDDEDFLLGETVTFTCSVLHGTSPSFIWFHNENVIDELSIYYQLIDHQKQLYIDSLQIHHSGTYQCKASNKLSPNRTFSVLSVPRYINVLEPSPTVESNVLIIALSVVLLTILTAAIGFIHRQKMAPLLINCAFNQFKTERTNGPARITHVTTIDVGASSTNSGQEDYSNIPSMGRVDCEDICYAHIGINRLAEASPHPNKCNEEFSVTYSAIKSSTDTETTQRTPVCTDLYQNFSNNRFQS
ncbi:Fc receptor-like protein 3 [Anomaloglossus baeobatrachus]|uniref:Fc receptor-like protein 3 n=1 Tax=Anomaloglossus baeobatrachus TaxID=238106 RepID=UPI003F5076D2